MKSVPGGKEIQAQAKAGFQHREHGTVAPALWQVVPRQKHMPGLIRTAIRGVIDVVIERRARRSVVEKFQAGGGDTCGRWRGGLFAGGLLRLMGIHLTMIAVIIDDDGARSKKAAPMEKAASWVWARQVNVHLRSGQRPAHPIP